MICICFYAKWTFSRENWYRITQENRWISTRISVTEISQIRGCHFVYVRAVERCDWLRSGTKVEQTGTKLERARTMIGRGCSIFVPLLPWRLAGLGWQSSPPIFQVAPFQIPLLNAMLQTLITCPPRGQFGANKWWIWMGTVEVNWI
jgi:hypothetical protein